MVLSQFTVGTGSDMKAAPKKTLKDFFTVPNDVYPVGRLDYDSEGLLLLTNDASINHKLLHPLFSHEREYRVQVEGSISEPALHQLRSGVEITVDGQPYLTKPCSVEVLHDLAGIAERNPPIRFRKNIATSWIKMVITEGKNRQVRKMTAMVGFPTLRLVRHRIEQLTADRLQPGEMRELRKHEIYTSLKLV